MAIALRGAAAAGNSGPGIGTVSLPAPAIVGSLVVVQAGRRSATATGLVLLTGGYADVPGGLNDFAGVESFGHRLYYLIAAGGEQTVNFQAATNPASINIAEFSGFGASDPAGFTADVADITDSATPTYPQITPAAGRAAVILACDFRKTAGPNPGPAALPGYAIAADTGFASLGNRHRLLMYYRIENPTVGSYGPVSEGSTTSATDDSNLIHVAMSPLVASLGFPGDPGGSRW